jgi:protein N-terminal methyltransferase
VVRLMDRCIRALKPDGILFVKENICKQGAVPDGEDASVTRSDDLMRRLFERAGALGAATMTTTGGSGGGSGGGGGGGKGGKSSGGGKKPVVRKWKLAHNVKQRNFPKNLFEVRMYVLKPAVAAA